MAELEIGGKARDGEGSKRQYAQGCQLRFTRLHKPPGKGSGRVYLAMQERNGVGTAMTLKTPLR